MNLDVFFSEYQALANHLKESSFDKMSGRALACRISYLEFGDEIKIITDRIKNESEEFQNVTSLILEKIGENEKIEKEAEKALDLFSKLKLDIKDFYLHTKIFIDTLYRIAKIIYGKSDDRYYDFKKKLKNFKDFREKRNKITHELAQLKFTTTKEGKFGFDIPHSFNASWGTNTVNSINDFVVTTLKNLSNIIKYLRENYI